MALISTKTILTSLSLFHITLAYFFFTSPASIADQALVYVLGEATGMPQTTAFNAPSPTASFLSIALLVLGFSDLLTLSMPEEIWLIHYWGSQAPLRLLIFGVLTVYTCLSAPSGTKAGRFSHPVAPRADAYGAQGAFGGGGAKWDGGGWDGLRNRVFFAFAFLEMLSWFWVWVTLREEAAGFTTRKRRRGSTAAAERL